MIDYVAKLQFIMLELSGMDMSYLSYNLYTQHNNLTSCKDGNIHPRIINGSAQDSKPLLLPHKEFKEHEIQTQVMEA